MARHLISAGLAVLAASALGACASEPFPTGMGEFEEPPTFEEIQETDWLARAADAENRRAWEEAAFFLDRWLLGNEPDASWYERRARAAAESGDLEGAIVHREQLVRLQPEDDLLKVDLADDMQRAGRGEDGAQVLEDLARQPGSRLVALRALGELHERDSRWLDAAGAYERLAEVPGTPDPRVLYQNAARLRELGGDLAGALKAVEKALEGVDLREEERRTLERLRAFETGEPRNVADAVALLGNHPDPDFRLKGASYLIYDRFPDDDLVFADALGDSDSRVVRIAAREVSLRGGPDQAHLLSALLAHTDPDVQLAAARGLGRIGTSREVPALISMLDPDDRAMFRAARSTIERITGHTIGVELDPDLERRQELARSWQEWWESRGTGGSSRP